MSREKENGRKKWDVAFIEAGRPLGSFFLFAQGEACSRSSWFHTPFPEACPTPICRIKAGVPAQGASNRARNSVNSLAR